MLVFNYEFAAAKEVDGMDYCHLYLMAGPLPTSAEEDVSFLTGNCTELYNQSLGFLEVEVKANEANTISIVEYPAVLNPDYNSKGWQLHTDGNWYCPPDTLDLSETETNPGSYDRYTGYGVECVKKVYSRTGFGAVAPNFKTIIYEYDSPISINTVKKGYTATAGNYLYAWIGNDWVEVVHMNNGNESDFSFPEVTSDKFKFYSDSAAASDYWIMLGNTSAQAESNATHTITHGVLVSTKRYAADVAWNDAPNATTPSLTFSVGKPGDDNPLILTKNEVKRGETLRLAQCSFYPQGIGNDLI